VGPISRRGELRTSQNWIGPGGCTLADATFIPPPPHEVPQALAELEQFLHADNPPPALMQVGLVHAQFEPIHPFLDGNGRVGRLLITFLLTEKKLLARPVLYLSHYFKRYRTEYYERLQVIRDTGDWEGWLAFFLRGVAGVSREATQTAAAIVRMREEYRAKITDRLGRAAANGHRIMDKLFDHPIVTVARVREWLKITPGARTISSTASWTSACYARSPAMPATGASASIRISNCSKSLPRRVHEYDQANGAEEPPAASDTWSGRVDNCAATRTPARLNTHAADFRQP
jgi:hypothetical protein